MLAVRQQPSGKFHRLGIFLVGVFITRDVLFRAHTRPPDLFGNSYVLRTIYHTLCITYYISYTLYHILYNLYCTSNTVFLAPDFGKLPPPTKAQEAVPLRGREHHPDLASSGPKDHMARHSIVRFYIICFYIVRCTTIWYNMVWCNRIWYSMVWCNLISYSMVWYNVIWYSRL